MCELRWRNDLAARLIKVEYHLQGMMDTLSLVLTMWVSGKQNHCWQNSVIVLALEKQRSVAFHGTLYTCSCQSLGSRDSQFGRTFGGRRLVVVYLDLLNFWLEMELVVHFDPDNMPSKGHDQR